MSAHGCYAAHGKSQKVAKRALCPLINSKVIEAANLGDASVLLCVIRDFLPDMNLVNLTTSLHRLAKVCSESADARMQLRCPAHQQVLQDVLAGLAAALLRSEPSLNDSRRQALANIIWSLGTLRCVQMQLLQITAGLAQGQLGLFKPFELASTIWAFAKLGALHPSVRELVAPIQAAAVAPLSSLIGKLGFRFLTMSAWALAASGLAGEPVMARIAARLVPLLRGQDCLPELLVDVAWAFSSAGLRHERLLAEVARQGARDLGRFAPNELAELVQVLSAERAGADFLDACAARGFALCPAPAPCVQAPAPFAAAPAPPSPPPQLRASAAAFVPSAPAKPTSAAPATPATPASCPASCAKAEAQRGTGSTLVRDEEDGCFSDTDSDWITDGASESPASALASPGCDGSPARSSRAWADLNEDVDADDVPEFGAEAAREACPEASPLSAKYSVKNTFLELDEAGLTPEEAEICRRLPPACGFALAATSSEELDILRLRYQLSRDW